LGDAVGYARLQEEAAEALKSQGKMLNPMASKAPLLPAYKPNPYQSSPSNPVSRA